MLYIGIDPGQNGGIGIIDTLEDKAEALFYTDENLLESLCRPGKVRVVVEEVHAFPSQGVTSMFNFGKAYGIILGILTAYRISYELVTPKKWKKEFSLDSDKKKSIECCQRLFPTVDLRKNERSRLGHDGKAEALLLAEYARRHMK